MFLNPLGTIAEITINAIIIDRANTKATVNSAMSILSFIYFSLIYIAEIKILPFGTYGKKIMPLLKWDFFEGFHD
jgi:hypothetical protein